MPSQRMTVVDLLKMSDETDLDILNNSMDTMVEQFPEELLPVAAMLTARLVCRLLHQSSLYLIPLSSASRICVSQEKLLSKIILKRMPSSMIYSHRQMKMIKRLLQWAFQRPSAL
jgi:hypothetical protein